MQSRWKKYVTAVLIISMVASLLTGCGSSSKASKSGSTKDTLTVAVDAGVVSLDPIATNDVASSNVMTQIYETLVQLNDKGEVIPMLAESFKQTDSVTYEFKLKKGVKFHNGEELKASDVKFSFTRASKAPAVAHIMGDIDTSSFKTPDDYTISFKLKKPNTGFLASLVHTGASIVNEKAVTAAGDKYAMNPVGTGPFKFVSCTKGSKTELTRFDDFHGDKPKFKNMVLKVIPEPTNRVIELETGAADIAYNVSTNDVKRVQENSKLQLQRVIDNSTAYMGFNTQKKPFDDVRVRQAISYAIDTTQVVNTVWKGIGKPAVGPIAPNLKYSNTTLKAHEYNVEKAKELLKEAGYPNGFKTTISTNDRKERVDMATIMQSELKEIGIDAEIKVLEWAAYVNALGTGQHDMFILGWVCQTPDPDMAVYSPFLSTNKGAGGNYAYFSDSKLDSLITQGRSMADSDARKEVYYQIQQEIIDQAPWVFLNNGEQVVGTSKSVKGFKPSPFGYHVLYNVSFE